MIIDVHYHLIPIKIPLDTPIMENTIKEPLRAAKIAGIEVDKDTLKQKASKTWFDLRGKNLINNMNEAGIDYTIVCNVDNSENELFTYDLVQQVNNIVSDITKKYPDRLMALAGIDPRRPEALDMLKQCFEEFGMKGLKYHGDFGYDPSGPESYLLLEYLEKNN